MWMYKEENSVGERLVKESNDILDEDFDKKLSVKYRKKI